MRCAVIWLVLGLRLTRWPLPVTVHTFPERSMCSCLGPSIGAHGGVVQDAALRSTSDHCLILFVVILSSMITLANSAEKYTRERLDGWTAIPATHGPEVPLWHIPAPPPTVQR